MRVVNVRNLLAFMLLFLNSLLFGTDYTRLTLPQRDYQGLKYLIDLRYLNSVDKAGDLKKADTAFYELLSINRGVVKDFIIFVYNERSWMRNSGSAWIDVNPDKVYSGVKRYFKDKKTILKYLPNSVYIMTDRQAGVNVVSSSVLVSSFVESARKDNKIRFSDLKKVNDNLYCFYVYGYFLKGESDPGSPIIFFLNRLKSPLFSRLNGKFALNTVVLTSAEPDTRFISASAKFIPSYELKLITGEISNNLDYVPGEIYYTRTGGLRLRTQPQTSGSSKILTTLSAGEEVRVVEIGKYEVVKNVGGDWLKVKTKAGLTGWCFGTYLTNKKL